MTRPRRYDLVVIGSGPGGQKAAMQAASAGLKVAIVERDRKAGGSCVHQGTIPSKTLREAALAIATLKRNAGFFDFKLKENMEVSTLMGRLDSVLNSYAAFIEDYLGSVGVERLHGRASLRDPNTVAIDTVNGQSLTLETEAVVVATGSRPRTPPEIDVDHENILDSDSILSMIYLPRSLAVAGAGVIAAEYASIFSLLGVEVVMFDRTERPLAFMDPELTGKFLDSFRRYGGRYIGQVEPASIEWDGVSQVRTVLDSGETVACDKMLVAKGRIANTETLGLEALGVELGRNGTIPVDENYHTAIPGVYAVGDAIGPPSLASVSMEQGRRAVCHLLGVSPGRPIELVPIGIYAVPELASVGLSEEEARKRHGEEVLVGRARFEEVARGQIAGLQNGLLKMIADPRGERILGVHIVAEGATDLVHMGEMAILNGNPVGIFLENVLNFPTLGEAYRIAAIDILRQRAARDEAFANGPKSPATA